MNRFSFSSLSIIILSIFFFSFEDKPPYKIFDKKASANNYDKMIKSFRDADIVLFGEMHNNPVCHWLELSIAKDLFKSKKEDLILGAEMFESDDQSAIDEYLKGAVSDKELEKQITLWSNYASDYKPLLELSSQKKIPMIATSIPRKLASLVAKNGLQVLDTVNDESKKHFPPLPVEMNLELPGYKILKDADSHHGAMAIPYMAEAQALKDATMAHFIFLNWKKGKLFFHINGSYHSDNFEGICWFLKKKNPDLKIITVTSVEQDEIKQLEKENKGKADYTICITGDMTKTY
ncbi:MAG: ChaN family lipoprotein [Cytophagaceae bacterium]|nr:ChaN family lipoprotein [Cytophagaceae bacterium]